MSEPAPDLSQVVALLERIATAAEPAEALDAAGVARLLSVSVSKVHGMNAGGLLPSPVELGDRCPRWMRAELLAWLRAGAPSRARWGMLRPTVFRQAG